MNSYFFTMFEPELAAMISPFLTEGHPDQFSYRAALRQHQSNYRCIIGDQFGSLPARSVYIVS